jgi:hypothetical protein
LAQVEVAILGSTPIEVAGVSHALADCCFMEPAALEAFDNLGRQIVECYQRSINRRHAAHSD